MSVDKQSDTCSANSFAGSKIIALGVRTDEFSEDAITACFGDADASGAAPSRATEHVAKLNDAFSKGEGCDADT